MTTEDKQSEAETTDPDGARIVLDDGVWNEKIVRDHPEIEAHMDDVLQAVSAPDHVAPDPNFERRKRYYARGVGPSRWLLVVVSYEQTPRGLSPRSPTGRTSSHGAREHHDRAAELRSRRLRRRERRPLPARRRAAGRGGRGDA